MIFLSHLFLSCLVIICMSVEYSLYVYMDVVEWSRALDVRLSEWCCSVSMVWVQILSREEQKFDSSKNLILTLFGLIFRRIYIYIGNKSVAVILL